VRERTQAVLDWILLLGFCGFFFFYGIANFGLIGADEPRYAQVAREMLQRHDWITPVLGGKPWLEKPVLYYWQAMISYKLFGVSDWAARLPSAFDATLMVFAIWIFLYRFRRGSQLDGALMTASAAAVIGFARAASTDMPLAAMFVIGMLSWCSWYTSKRKSDLTLFYAFIGLATLAKGPVAPFLASLLIVAFALAKGDRAGAKQSLWVPGIVAFCLVSLPWYVLVQLHNPEFFRVFILQHNLERFGTNLYHHVQPFWYYLPVSLLGSIPWTVLVIAGLALTVRVWKSERMAMFRSDDWWLAFLFIWLTLPIAFFSISQSKLPGYILPALPAGTLLVAEYVSQITAENRRPNAIWVIIHSAVAAAPLVPALMIQYIILQHHLPWNRGTRVSCVLAGMLAIAIAATLLGARRFRYVRFVTLVPLVLALTAVLRIGSPALNDTLSSRALYDEMSKLQSELPPLAIYQVPRETEYGLAFYSNQVLGRYEWKQIPATAHVLVAPEGRQEEVAKRVPGRRVSYLGSLASQHVEYFWVARSPQ
jgi:4-amino-4-deoxy-L-arabinose transferase-like glycosyltransferase